MIFPMSTGLFNHDFWWDCRSHESPPPVNETVLITGYVGVQVMTIWPFIFSWDSWCPWCFVLSVKMVWLWCLAFRSVYHPPWSSYHAWINLYYVQPSFSFSSNPRVSKSTVKYSLHACACGDWNHWSRCVVSHRSDGSSVVGLASSQNRSSLSWMMNPQGCWSRNHLV